MRWTVFAVTTALLWASAGPVQLMAQVSPNPVPHDDPIDCPAIGIAEADRTAIGASLLREGADESPAETAAQGKLRNAAERCQKHFNWSDEKMRSADFYARAGMLENAARRALTSNRMILLAADRAFRKMTPQMKEVVLVGQSNTEIMELFDSELKGVKLSLDNLTYDEGYYVGNLLSALTQAERYKQAYVAAK